MNEIKEYSPVLEVTPANVKLKNYEHLKERAEDIARLLKTTVVSEDTIKENKKVIAQSRKLVDGLDRERIKIKKEILKDYVEFESQVNELKSIVNDADQFVRNQIKELEEQEREEKKKEIKKIWDLRIPMYEVSAIPDLFGKWFTPAHLNKSKSMKSIEEDMVKFLERAETDLSVVRGLANSEKVMPYYLESLSISDALIKANQQEGREKQAKQILKTDKTPEEIAVFVVTGTKDILLAEMLFKENKLNYKRG